MEFRRKARLAVHVALSVCPSFLKVPVYRHVFGFRIARGARIGCSVLDVDELELEEGAHIGHGNLLTRTRRVSLGPSARIGYGNIIRGGEEVALAKYAVVMRFNVLNSIPDNDCEGPSDPRLRLGPGAYVVSGHRLDFTDRIEIGTNSIVAGRNSSLWTHNRQQTRPIRIGDFCYLGSEVRLGPGAELQAWSILGMGAVLAKQMEAGRVVAGGVPAKEIRALNAEDERQLKRKTRPDIPSDAY